jgi:hypothetical protein
MVIVKGHMRRTKKGRFTKVKTHYRINKKPVGLGKAVEYQHKYPNQIMLSRLKDEKITGTSRYNIYRKKKEYR